MKSARHQSFAQPDTQLSVWQWMQDFVDAEECVTRDELRAAVQAAWAAIPESCILDSFRHVPEVHNIIVANNGGNRHVGRGT